MRPVRLVAAASLLLLSWGCSSKNKAGQVDAGTPPVVTQQPPPTPLPNPMVISEITPAQGPSTGGTVLVIRGLNFDPHATVTFGGAAATDVYVDDPQTLSLTTPAGTAGPVDVVVSNPDGAKATFTQGFTYYDLSSSAAPAPVVSAVTPNTGPASGGTVALLAGSNFQAGALVIVGGRPARGSTFVDATKLTLTTPQGAVGAAKIAVTNPDGRSGLLTNGFGYYDPSTAGAAPQLLTIAPADGPVQGGQSASATGSHLDAAVMAFLGGIPVTLSAHSDSALSFSTPANNRGLADFAVTNPDGQSAVLVQAYNYFLPPPQVLGVNPSFGPAAGGTAVVIAGEGFAQGATATVGGQPLQNLVVSSSETITGTAPAATDGGGPADVVVQNPDGLAGALAGGYFYTDATHPAPTSSSIALARVSPNTGPATGGITVTAFGGGFQSGATVSVGSASATNVRLLGSTTLSFTLPAGNVGPADVSVTNSNGLKATLKVGFVYFDPNSNLAAPVITNIAPSAGPSAGGSLVAISGTGFVNGAEVFIGANQATSVSVTSATSITATVPPGTAGAVDVLVINPDGHSSRLAQGFSYYDATAGDGGLAPPPTVSAVAPNSGSTQSTTTVLVSGGNFGNGAVVFAGTAAAATRFGDAGVLEADLPPQAAGTVDLTVANPDGQFATLAGAFTYVVPTTQPPRIGAVSPTSGPTGATTTVTITGAYFQSGAVVNSGGADVTTRFLDGGALSADLPPHAAGAVDLKVTNPDGQSSTLGSAFTYVAPAAPTIASVSPNTGRTDQTTTVVVTGANFLSGAVVSAGSAAATTRFLDGGALSADLPAHASGAVDLTVTNPDGQAATLTNGFTYVLPPAPTIASVSPSVGAPSGNSAVLISGANFLDGAQIYFGGLLATATVLDSQSIRAITPASSPGFVDVTVQNPDGQVATLAASFEYRLGYVPGPAPSLTWILPASGPSTGGTKALLRGSGFQSGMAVQVGNHAARCVVTSDTQATVTVPAGPIGTADVVAFNPDGQYATLLRGFTYVDPSTLGPAPGVTGATPNHGPATALTSLYVTGSGFVSGAIFFLGDNVADNILYVHQGLLRGSAPPADAGTVDLTVTNPDGQSTTDAAAFTYDPAPTVTGVAPASGPTAGGTTVLVSGSGYRSGATVYFGPNASGSVQVMSASLLAAVTPSGTKGPTDVTVVDSDGQQATDPGAFSYVAPPTVGSITPSTGPDTGGSVIVINGSDFQAGVTVTVGGQAATVLGASGSQIVVQTPAGSNGSATVVVTNPDGQKTTLPGAFTFVNPSSLGAAPSLSAVDPTQGSAAGGTRAAFYGANFKSGLVLILGGQALSATDLASATAATGLTPAGSAGATVDAYVTNPDGQSAKLPSAFTYLDPSALPSAPQLFAVTPNQGSVFGGDSVVISGQGFTPGSFAMINGVPQPTTNVTSNQVTFTTIQAPQVGTYDVSVTTGEGQTATLSGAFTFVVPAPQPQSASPSSGPAIGGTTVTVTGRNFDNGASVKVGNSAATSVTVISPTQISFVTPPGSDGPAAITITNPDGQSGTLAGGYTFVAAPSVTSVSPTSGTNSGGTSVTLNGAYFRTGATVTIGAAAATNVVLVSANVITCKTPAGAAGPAAVTVTNTDGQSGTLAGGFTYLTPVPPPAVTSVSPNYGPTSGGTLVSVVGSGFQAGARVFFGGAEATNVKVASSTSLTCATPGGTAGAVTVTVENPDLQAFSLTNGFTYLAAGANPPLQLIAVTPNTGSSAGGTVITLSGRGIQNGAAVTVGGLAATNVIWLGPTGIQATTPAHAAGTVDVTVTNPGASGQSATLSGGFRYDAGGRFVAASQVLPMESLPNKQAAVLFDFDNDGDSDLLILRNGCVAPNGPLLYRNDNGVFNDVTTSVVNATNIPTCETWFDAVIGDFNGDGWTDVFLIGNSNRTLLINNQGILTWAGNFNSTNAGRTPNVGCTARSGASGDVNGDGKLDMVVGCYGQDEQVFLNSQWPDGGASLYTDGGLVPNVFEVKNFDPLTQGNDATNAIVLGDVDKDGDLDAFTAQDSNQAKQLYLNDGKGRFVPTTPGVNIPSSANGNSSSAVMRDLNGDGCPDIIVGNYGQQNKLLINDCQGKFSDVTTSQFPSETDLTTQLLLMDVDHDGDYDLVTLTNPSYGVNRVRIYLNAGNGSFGDVTTADVPGTLGEYVQALAKVAPAYPNLSNAGTEATQYDLTGDGYPDLVEVNQAAQNRLLSNLGAGSPGTFTYGTMSALPEENDRSYAAVVGDINGDGYPDVVRGVLTGAVGTYCALNADGYIQILMNDRAGNLVDDTAARFPPGLNISAGAFSLVDVNNDGSLDLVVTQAYSKTANNVYLFLNDGTGHFTDVSQARLPSTTRKLDGSVAVTPIDYNGDGNMDLLIGNYAGVRLWENIGPGYFLDVTNGSGLDTINTSGTYCPGFTKGITVQDMDGDGRPDIFLARANVNGTNDLLLINQGDGTFKDVTSSQMPSATSGWQALILDADQNSTPDVYLANSSDDRLLFNFGGSLSDVTLSKLPARTGYTCSAGIIDVDQDGVPDVFLGKNSGCNSQDAIVNDRFWSTSAPSGVGGQNRVLTNIGSGTYQDDTATRLPVSTDNTSNVLVGDFNKDGKPDLFLNNEGQSRIYYWAP